MTFLLSFPYGFSTGNFFFFPCPVWLLESWCAWHIKGCWLSVLFRDVNWDSRVQARLVSPSPLQRTHEILLRTVRYLFLKLRTCSLGLASPRVPASPRMTSPKGWTPSSSSLVTDFFLAHFVSWKSAVVWSVDFDQFFAYLIWVWWKLFTSSPWKCNVHVGHHGFVYIRYDSRLKHVSMTLTLDRLPTTHDCAEIGIDFNMWETMSHSGNC